MPLGGEDPGSLTSVKSDTCPPTQSLSPFSSRKESTALALLRIVSTTVLPFPTDPNSPQERSLEHRGIPIVRQVRPQGRGCAPTGVRGRGRWDRGAEGRRDRRGYYLQRRWAAPDGCPGWKRGEGGSLSFGRCLWIPEPPAGLLAPRPSEGQVPRCTAGAPGNNGHTSPIGQRVYVSGLEQVSPPPLLAGLPGGGTKPLTPFRASEDRGAPGLAIVRRRARGGDVCHGSAMPDGSTGRWGPPWCVIP